jgi:hypothetical protein
MPSQPVSLFTAAMLLAVLTAAAPAMAADESQPTPDPLLQAERLIGRVLGSVDLGPLVDELEHAMDEAAAGRQPDLAGNPALREWQTRMQERVQAQMQQAAPLIVKGMLSAMRPLLREMQEELRALQPEQAQPPRR